jgi:hypothetical protein
MRPARTSSGGGARPAASKAPAKESAGGGVADLDDDIPF